MTISHSVRSCVADRTIARMPARIASGRACHVSMTACTRQMHRSVHQLHRILHRLPEKTTNSPAFVG